MKDVKPVELPSFERLYLFIYLIPIFGFFPALWTLYRHQGTQEQLTVSRLSVTLSGSWLLGYLLLGTAGEMSDSTFRLLLLNTLLTSGYFLVSVWLIIRLGAKSSRLPGFSDFAERVLGKYLSK